MACDSDKSDASTSGTDDEAEMEQHEYERKRELYLSKVIFCERKYQEIKPILLRLRLNQIEALQDSILNHKSDYYLTRKAVLDGEFETKRNHIQILRQLRLEALTRRLVGDRHNAARSLVNNKALVREAIRESIEHKYAKLRREQLDVERLTGLSFGSNGHGDFERTMTAVDADEAERRLIAVNVIERYVGKREDGAGGRPLWSDIPVLIAQLPRQTIDEDLQTILGSTENVSIKPAAR